MTASTGQTLPAKILGAKAGARVAPGDRVEVTPDVTLSGGDGDTIAIVRALAARDGGRVLDPEMHVFVLDGCAVGSEMGAAIRAFVEAQGIDHFYDRDSGLAHQVAAEQGFALPGRLILGCDPRAVTCGAFGAYATTVAPHEMAGVMAEGQVRLPVPETVRLIARGAWPAGVGAADLALRVLADLQGGAADVALELGGPAVTALGVAGRMALCDLATESGAVSSYVEPDALTLAWLNGRARDNFDLVRSDGDALYQRTLEVDVDRLEPQVMGPGLGEAAVPVSAAAGTPLDEVVIGGGASGRLSDLRAAAAVLGEHRGIVRTRLLILPASAGVLREAAADGTLCVLLKAGAFLLNPGCGTCMDRIRTAPAAGEAVLSAADRGLAATATAAGAACWRASALTCAASALAGRIADPREVVGEQALRAAAAATRE